MKNEFGEHIQIGELGQFSIYLAFTAALIAGIAFFIAATKKEEKESLSWRNIGKISFLVHAAAVCGIILSLFIIIYNHYYEYRYAWEHSSNALPVKYILSCFWSGQEGSFLLWIWWDMVLGLILLFKLKIHKAEVMAIFCLVQVFLGSMLLGLKYGDFYIGSTPFILLKDYMVDAPVFKRADYMQLPFMADGKDLNPLLQNYWMVIHPPTLFLGFASTLVPFALALSALWKRSYTNWMKPVLPWALFCGAVLGTGIMMGGAWAYESLSFGGYWAWDPVENASLVPWVILIAGIHTLLAAQKTGHSLRITFIFFFLSFLLVLYSTFLTRSGILGDTSVHAFTDLGMNGQLLIYLIVLSFPAFFLFFKRLKEIPHVKKEEETWTREFWMFIGSLVLLISAIHITVVTSFPVWNTIFHKKWNITHPIEHYNSVQLPIAVIIALLSSMSLFLKFKKTADLKKFFRSMILFLVLSVIFSALISYSLQFTGIADVPLIVLLFAGIFALLSNGYYLILVLKGKWRVSGPAVAHLGFGIMMIGILISSAKQEPISLNTKNVDYGKSFTASEQPINILLNKNIPDTMKNYRVTYLGDSLVMPHRYFKVRYEKMDEAGNVTEQFILYPESQVNAQMGGLVANPSTKHYFTKDVFTHISSYYAPDEQEGDNKLKYVTYKVKVGDSISTSNGILLIGKPISIKSSDKVLIAPGDLAVAADINIRLPSGNKIKSDPILLFKDKHQEVIADSKPDFGFKIKMIEIDGAKETITFDVATFTPEHEFVVMKAIIFPFINLVWMGFYITIAGFVISLIRVFNKKSKAKAATEITGS